MSMALVLPLFTPSNPQSENPEMPSTSLEKPLRVQHPDMARDMCMPASGTDVGSHEASSAWLLLFRLVGSYADEIYLESQTALIKFTLDTPLANPVRLERDLD
jgi:hypothetical protein